MRLEKKILIYQRLYFSCGRRKNDINLSHPQGLLESVLRVRRRVAARQGFEASDIYLSLCLYILLGNGYHRAKKI